MQSGRLELVSADAENLRASADSVPDSTILSASATALARKLAWLPGQHASPTFQHRCRDLSSALKPLLEGLEAPPPRTVSHDFRWLHDNFRLLETELENVHEIFRRPERL